MLNLTKMKHQNRRSFNNESEISMLSLVLLLQKRQCNIVLFQGKYII